MRSVEATSRCGLVAAIAFMAGHPLALLAGKEAVDEPWSVSSSDPVVVILTSQASPGAAGQFDPGSSLLGDFGYSWLRFYQKYLSSSGAKSCPMAPSCSRYSIQAIGEHGLLTGVVMTADRLIHEAEEKRWVKQVGKDRDAKYSDPVENNDFWWYKR